MSHSYAQTNIQLYNQLQAAGYSPLEQQRVFGAHQLGLLLFGGLVRPNGKLFMAHLIGTASILVAQSARVAVVIAGLLHAAYSHGQFPDPRRGATSRKRARVRSIVGTDTEMLIDGYARLKLNHPAIEAWSQRDFSKDSTERDIVMIRLANELEDHLDLANQYGGKKKRYGPDNQGAALLAEIARKMGLADLAQELEIELQPKPGPSAPAALALPGRTSVPTGPPIHWRLVKLVHDRLQALGTTMRNIRKRHG
jgi:(p)ppGpp synthase/HD superfamily hydrolase